MSHPADSLLAATLGWCGDFPPAPRIVLANLASSADNSQCAHHGSPTLLPLQRQFNRSDFVPNMPSSAPTSRSRRIVRRVLIGAGVLVAVWLASSYYVACRLVRRPHPLAAEPTPALAWGQVESFRLTTRDGKDLGAWFIEGPADSPLVLFLHGNGGNRSTSLKQAELLHSAGCGVLLISLRAHGDSSGDVNDAGYSAAQDVVAAIDWLKEHHPGRPIVVWGESLGAAAALFAAEELGPSVQGYLIECPYQDLRTAVRNRTTVYLPPLLDRVAYAGLVLVAPLVIGDVERISPLQAAARAPHEIPLLILAGGKDSRATVAEARAIQTCWGSRAELLVIENADHSQLFQTDPDHYLKALTGFLQQIPASSQPQ